MPLYDSADLLSRAQVMAQRPTVDEDVTDAQWYSWLTDAQVHWMGEIASLAPAVNYSPPELMTSTDSGVTYTTAFAPMGNIEVLATLRGPLLTPGTYWGDGDFVAEGQTVRMVGNRARTFAGGGPYARYVRVPGVLDASNQPVLKPAHMRTLLVPTACVLFATRGGFRDPSPFVQEEQRLWSGNPLLAGSTGFLGQLKQQYFGDGSAAVGSIGAPWYINSDFGVGR